MHGHGPYCFMRKSYGLFEERQLGAARDKQGDAFASGDSDVLPRTCTGRGNTSMTILPLCDLA